MEYPVFPKREAFQNLIVGKSRAQLLGTNVTDGVVAREEKHTGIMYIDRGAVVSAVYWSLSTLPKVQSSQCFVAMQCLSYVDCTLITDGTVGRS